MLGQTLPGQLSFVGADSVTVSPTVALGSDDAGTESEDDVDEADRVG